MQVDRVTQILFRLPSEIMAHGRVENPTESSSTIDAKDPQKGPQKKDMAPAPLPSIEAELMDAPKH